MPYRRTPSTGGSGASVSDATTSAKGIVQLAGDLGGTAAAPTVPGLAAKAALLTPTAIKTAAYTAVVGDLAMMNVPGGATALTLPPAPADKAQVGYRAIGATTAVPLVVTAGGADTIGLSGAASASVVLADETTVLQYQAASTRWIAMSNVKTQTSLDARYATTVASRPVVSGAVALTPSDIAAPAGAENRYVGSVSPVSTTATSGNLLIYVQSRRKRITVQNLGPTTIKLGYSNNFNPPGSGAAFTAATLLPGEEFIDETSTAPLWAYSLTSGGYLRYAVTFGADR